MKKKLRDILSSVSIELKIYGMVIIVVLLVTAISLIVVRVSITNTLTLQIEDRAKSISSDIASRSTDPLLTHNIYALQSLVTDTIESYQDLEYVFILNNDEEVVVHSNEKGFISQGLIEANHLKLEDDSFVTNGIKLSTDKGMIFDSASPILQDLGGTVRVGLTYQSLDDALFKVTSQMMFTMIGVILLAGLIVFSLTRIITLPITNLVQLTNKVYKGNYTERIITYPKDEIGKLTLSFNRMLDALQKSEKERKKYIEKIHNRNKELILLNGISKNIKNDKELKEMLQFFVKQLVNEFYLKSAAIEVQLAGTTEKFYDHSCKDALHCGNFDHRFRTCTNSQKETYSFPINRNVGTKIGSISICSSSKLDGNFLKFLSSLVNQLSVSIENLELWNELKKKEEVRLMLLEKVISVQEDERKRIARELHDETSHSLSSMLVELKLLEEGDEVIKKKSINYLRKLVRNTIEELHQMAWQLRPSILDKFGLKVAIERYVQEFQRTNKIETELIMNGTTKSFSPEIETTIYRLIQESLTNITKYAQASSVSAIVLSTNQQISVMIEDDGVGFDTSTVLNSDPSKEHLGLLGMLERISLFNGTLEIESEPGEGTTILAKIPISVERGETIVI
ncbi:histidine kinase [Robertmurraya massiliosenegalensis]|uniref:histidine kinase n=1 Tax=Robertmurraya massiliosenegalensis TaxID=1287657 RepID=UPI0002EA3773|nr:histidine kinase [Robertmurraya massiliosenegalensis]